LSVRKAYPFEHEAALRQSVQANQAVAAVHHPHVVRIAVGEVVEVALARDHRRARQVNDALPGGGRQHPHRDRWSPQLGRQVGPPAMERPPLPDAPWRRGEKRPGARRGVGPRLEDQRRVEVVPECLDELPVGEDAREERLGEPGRVGFAGGLELRDPGPGVVLQLVECRRLSVLREERQQRLEQFGVLELLPVDAKASGQRRASQRTSGARSGRVAPFRNAAVLERAGVPRRSCRRSNASSIRVTAASSSRESG
jgi:hypothetical protein